MYQPHWTYIIEATLYDLDEGDDGHDPAADDVIQLHGNQAERVHGSVQGLQKSYLGHSDDAFRFFVSWLYIAGQMGELAVEETFSKIASSVPVEYQILMLGNAVQLLYCNEAPIYPTYPHHWLRSPQFLSACPPNSTVGFHQRSTRMAVGRSSLWSRQGMQICTLMLST